MALPDETEGMSIPSDVSRRGVIWAGLGAASLTSPLVGCAIAGPADPTLTKLHVLGVIHSNHLRSERYSLAVLEAAIRKAAPDVVLTEIPPDRIYRAISTFRETGVVDEPRTKVFPEYTQVLFPLSSEMHFRILGTAGWTRKIANDRRAALQQIQHDPARAQEWEQHLAAQRTYLRAVAGRGDDPLFIHTQQYDRLVEASRKPYQQFFDGDLGAGGWSQINRAHTDLINGALDELSGRGLRALITFGAAHKYKILASLSQRTDIELLRSRDLFV